MIGRFKGYREVDGTFKPVEGVGVLFMNNKAYILKTPIATGNVTRIQVIPASVSPAIFVQNLGHIFKNDVVKYTFKEKGEYYSRYYKVVEHNNLIKYMELYRDYDIDDEDFTVTRGKFTNNRGDFREIDKPVGLNEVYTIVGNTWQNLEFER